MIEEVQVLPTPATPASTEVDIKVTMEDEQKQEQQSDLSQYFGGGGQSSSATTAAETSAAAPPSSVQPDSFFDQLGAGGGDSNSSALAASSSDAILQGLNSIEFHQIKEDFQKAFSPTGYPILQCKQGVPILNVIKKC